MEFDQHRQPVHPAQSHIKLNPPFENGKKPRVTGISCSPNKHPMAIAGFCMVVTGRYGLAPRHFAGLVERHIVLPQGCLKHRKKLDAEKLSENRGFTTDLHGKRSLKNLQSQTGWLFFRFMLLGIVIVSNCFSNQHYVRQSMKPYFQHHSRFSMSLDTQHL